MIKIQNIAHRGLYNEECPENTLSAFKNALDHNYSIELDIQLTLDNKAIVFHDNNQKRLLGIDKKICDSNYSELLEHCINKSNEKIPLLSEVLSLVNGGVPILIELKENGKGIPIGPIIKELLLNYKGECLVQSFDHKQVVWFKKNMPSVRRGMLYTKKGYVYSWALNILSKPDFLALDIGISIEKATKQRKKRPVFIWTIRTIEDYIVAKKSFDAIIFENFEPEEW